MAKQLDVYRDWLGITSDERPLDYYQLMRLAKFEDNSEKIRAHYLKMNTHVRKYASGQYSQESQKLLNELAKAMLCLTDTQRKREYDASMGRKDTAEGRRRTFEEVLLANKIIDRDQLTKARSYADAVGLEIRDAVLQQKLATPEAVMLAYAESEGLPYIELDDIGVDEQLVLQIPPNLARQHSCVPVMIDAERLLMASAGPLIPDVEEELRLRLDMPVRTVLCTPAKINEAVTKYYPRDMPEPAPVAAKSAKKAKEPAAAKKAEKETAEPLTPEERSKRQLKFAVVAFNIAVVVTMLGRILLGGGRVMAGGDVAMAAVVAVTLGTIAAAITYFVSSKT